MDQNLQTQIAEFIARSAGASTDVEVQNVTSMRIGESKQNWLFELELSGGKYDGKQRFVVRMQAESPLQYTHTCLNEFNLLNVLQEKGIPAPEALYYTEDDQITPLPLFVMKRVAGRASAERVVAELGGSDDGDKLVDGLAAVLAKTHKIRPPNEELVFLGASPDSPAKRAIDNCYMYLDNLMENSAASAYPALEWGLRWLSNNLPPKEDIVLCHGDMRISNVMVLDKELTGILDWEYAEWSDPHEDLATFMAKNARYGAYDRVAGGVSNREVFLEAYTKHSKQKVDESRLLFWEIMANVKRALVCVELGRRHMSGLSVSLDLALMTHTVGHCELEILSLIDRAERALDKEEQPSEKKEKQSKKSKKDKKGVKKASA